MSRIVPLLLVVLVLLASFWSGLWWWSAHRLEEQFLQWQAAQAAEGRDFRFTEMRVGGFPTHLRLRLSEPAMTDLSGWEWRGPDVTAEAALWQPRRVQLEFPGTHSFQPPERSMLAPLEFAAGAAHGQLWLDNRGVIEGMRLAFQRLALAGYFDGGTRAQALEVGWGAAAVDAQEDADARDVPFFLEIRELELPSAAEPPLGRSLERLLAQGALEGWLQLGPPAESVPAWAARGGQVKLDDLQISWGPLRLQGEANLTLDQERRPLGAGHARIVGFEAALGAFAEAGLVQEDIGSMARLALLAMSSENNAGQRQLEVPMTAQEGILRVGPLPLLPLPRLF